jgi:hypothetical protein
MAWDSNGGVGRNSKLLVGSYVCDVRVLWIRMCCAITFLCSVSRGAPCELLWGASALCELPSVRCVRIPGTDGCLGNTSVGGCQPAILRQGGVTLHRWGTWSAMSSGVGGWFGGSHFPQPSLLPFTSRPLFRYPMEALDSSCCFSLPFRDLRVAGEPLAEL